LPGGGFLVTNQLLFMIMNDPLSGPRDPESCDAHLSCPATGWGRGARPRYQLPLELMGGDFVETNPAHNLD